MAISILTKTEILTYSTDMKYIVTDKSIAKDWGFDPATHRVSKQYMCLNEKEVLVSQVLKGTLEERAETLKGMICTGEEALILMND